MNREFQRMHKALEDKSEEAQRLREELQGTTFPHAGGQMQNTAGNSALAVILKMHSVHMMQSA